MTARRRVTDARSVATAAATAATAAKDWLIEPAESSAPEGAPGARGPDEPRELARLRPVPCSASPAGRAWLAPSAGGPALVASPQPAPPPAQTLPRRAGHAVLAEPLPPLPEAPPAAGHPQPLTEPALPLTGCGVVAVIGLGRRCGATVVARALACELARRDGAGASAVTADAASGGMGLGLPAAGQLARMLAPAGVGRVRTSGRLCLVGCADRPALAAATLYLAPLVLDGCDPREAPVTAAIADHLVIVGGRGVEPALATALSASLVVHAAGRPIVVANRAPGDGPWAERADVLLPESRLGAQLALAGQEPRGALGRAVSDLVDRLDSRSLAR